MIHLSIHPSVYPSIVNHYTRGPRLPFPWPRQPALMMIPRCSQGSPWDPPGSGSAPRSLLSWTCLENLHWEETRRNPYQKHPNWHLSTQRGNVSPPSSSWMSKFPTLSQRETPARQPLSWGNLLQPLYLQSLSFSREPPFMSKGKGKNEDWPVDQELCL